MYRNFAVNVVGLSPWTKAKLDAARELVEFGDKLTTKGKELLKNTLDDIIAENPKTEMAAINSNILWLQWDKRLQSVAWHNSGYCKRDSQKNSAWAKLIGLAKKEWVVIPNKSGGLS